MSFLSGKASKTRGGFLRMIHAAFAKEVMDQASALQWQAGASAHH